MASSCSLIACLRCWSSAGEAGYPTSTLIPHVPETEEEKTSLVDDLQAWKTTKYQELIGVLLALSLACEHAVLVMLVCLWHKPEPRPHCWQLVLGPLCL